MLWCCFDYVDLFPYILCQEALVDHPVLMIIRRYAGFFVSSQKPGASGSHSSITRHIEKLRFFSRGRADRRQPCRPGYIIPSPRKLAWKKCISATLSGSGCGNCVQEGQPVFIYHSRYRFFDTLFLPGLDYSSACRDNCSNDRQRYLFGLFKP